MLLVFRRHIALPNIPTCGIVRTLTTPIIDINIGLGVSPFLGFGLLVQNCGTWRRSGASSFLFVVWQLALQPSKVEHFAIGPPVQSHVLESQLIFWGDPAIILGGVMHLVQFRIGVAYTVRNENHFRTRICKRNMLGRHLSVILALIARRSREREQWRCFGCYKKWKSASDGFCTMESGCVYLQ